ncbi:MAG: glycosyltransferase [Bacteroidales bacterium]|nr:glycosyltransferase [Bacteroidales bacterium]
MITNRNFVFTGLLPWDAPLGSNVKDIAIEVSKHNRVIYVNTPLSYFEKTNLHDYRTQVVNPLRQIDERLWLLDCPFKVLPANQIGNKCLFNVVNRYNNRKIARLIRSTLRQLKMDEIILFCDNDVYRSFYLKELLRPNLTVYYRRDNLGEVTYWQKHVFRMEPALCAKSDLVIANSEELAAAVRKYNPNTHNVGQGLDLDSYNIGNTYSVPNDIAAIRRPIVGYVGWITSLRLDAGLIYDMARNRPDYSFVMVGSEDDLFAKHQLHSLPNVHFLGNKRPEDVPAYVAAFDVCMNPQTVNEITNANYPRKIDEYLALGKPTIATKTSTMKIFEACVATCTGLEDYLVALDDAVHNDSEEKRQNRIRLASSHSWENNVKSIYERIEGS